MQESFLSCDIRLPGAVSNVTGRASEEQQQKQSHQQVEGTYWPWMTAADY